MTVAERMAAKTIPLKAKLAACEKREARLRYQMERLELFLSDAPAAATEKGHAVAMLIHAHDIAHAALAERSREDSR